MRKLRKIKPATVLLMMYDIFAVLIASGLSLLIRFELRWTAVESVFWDSIVTYCVINIVTTVVVFYFFRLYSSLWRYAGEREIMSVILAVAVTDVIQYAGVHLLQLPLREAITLSIVYYDCGDRDQSFLLPAPGHGRGVSGTTGNCRKVMKIF